MNKEIVEEIHKYIDEPFKELMSAIERFEKQPSILKGVRRKDARDHFDEALRATAEYALETWHLTPEEFSGIVDGIMEYK